MPPLFVKPEVICEETPERIPTCSIGLIFGAAALIATCCRPQVKLSATQIRNARRSIGRRTAGVDGMADKTSEKQKDAEV